MHSHNNLYGRREGKILINQIAFTKCNDVCVAKTDCNASLVFVCQPTYNIDLIRAM